jgi:putative membrane protein
VSVVASAPARTARRASLGSVALLLLGAAGVALLLLWSGIGAALRDAAAALPVIPLTTAVQVGQLYLSALAWRLLLDRAVRRRTAFRLRVVREGVDSLLPVAQVGGEILAVGLLARRGVPVALAGAGTALDLLVEGAMLPVVVLLGLGTLWLLGGDVRALPAVLAAAGLGIAGAAGFALAQRLGLLRLIEAVARRLPAAMRVDGLHQALMARARDRRALALAALLHVAAWLGGALEVWLAMQALGHPVGLGPAFVIESLGMAARGAGFAVPGALGIQEGGFVAAAALFGIAPELALALSALKRVREVVVGLAGLALWRAERVGSKRPLDEAGR